METNIKLKEIKINSSIKKYELKTTLMGYASKGLPGKDGKDGTNGENGVTFTPSVDDEGNLSWTNDGNLDNPETKNIKGPKGDKGDTGAGGEPGSKGDQGEPGPKGDAGEGVPSGGTTGQVLKKKSNTDYDTEWVNESGGGSGGTSDYSDLSNKPKINNVELSGNKSLSDLGITNFSGNYNDLTNKPDIPTKTSDLTNDSGFLTNSIVELHGTTDNPVNLNILAEGCYKIYGKYMHGVDNYFQSDTQATTFLVGGWGIYPYENYKSIMQISSDCIKYISIQKSSDDTYTSQLIKLQNKLSSGINIKTINNESLLGSGNLTITGGADIPIQATAPENPQEGDFWIDTSANGETYGDTLPIGAIVEYNGTTVPQGYEKVSDGSIIESGSNENGNWIKYADGTMICTKRIEPSEFGDVQSYKAVYTIWTYPQKFISTEGLTTYVTPRNWSQYMNLTKTANPTTSTVQIMLACINLNPLEVITDKVWMGGVNAIAIGKWK